MITNQLKDMCLQGSTLSLTKVWRVAEGRNSLLVVFEMPSSFGNVFEMSSSFGNVQLMFMQCAL